MSTRSSGLAACRTWVIVTRVWAREAKNVRA